jgi:gas vesicle protein
MIQAQLEDGRILEFPDGTDPAIVQNTVKKILGVNDGAIAASPALATDDVREAGIGDQILGGLETAGTIASGVIAEPAGGIAGLVTGLLTQDPAAAEAVRSGVSDKLTFEPRTEQGQKALQATGEALQPVGEMLQSAESTLGDAAFDVTGSPSAAAAAATIPTALLEVFGLGAGGRLAKSSKRISPSNRAINKVIQESAPDAEAIKNAARTVYTSLDESGIRMKAKDFRGMARRIKRETAKQGLDARVTPRAAGEIDTLRKVAQKVAGNIDPSEASLGVQMINEIDGFLDQINPNALTKGNIPVGEVAGKYKAARTLWGRARRSEVIQEAITRGEDVAAGAEAGIRNEFNRILRNKKLSKFIPDDEKALMRDVVQGDFAQNMTRLVGKVGLSIDRSPNVFGSIVAGGGLGTVVGGTTGALIVPVVGTVSKQIAKTLTTNKARFVDSMIRAGSDGRKIARAYMTTVPKNKRSASQLSELLSDPTIDISDMIETSNKMIREATEIANGRRIIGKSLGTAAASASTIREESQ